MTGIDQQSELQLSMKIVGLHLGARCQQGLHSPGFYRHNSILILQHSRNDQERMVHDRCVSLVEKLWSNDDVRNACFIFQAQKHKSFGRAGALASDDGAGYAHEFAIGKGWQLNGRRNALPLQNFSLIGHAMKPNRQASAAKIGVEPLFRVHAVKG